MLSGYRKPKKFAVFISGGGSTLQSLIEMQHELDVVLVVSNKKSAAGLKKAARFGKVIHVINKETTFEQLHQILLKQGVERIILAGFMKILPPIFVNLWKDKIINIHPSLLPNYKGLDSAERSWQDNFDIGVSLHKVIAEMDEGPLLKQQVALKKPQSLSLNEALLFLRRTEQHLLRQFCMEGAL